MRITIVRQGYDEPAGVHGHPRRDPAALRALPLHGHRQHRLHPPAGLQRDHRLPAAARRDDCERELEKALRDLQRAGRHVRDRADIRDNPGGLLDQAFAVSNLFLKKGQLVVFTRGRTRRDESSYVTEGESRFADMPLIVLTSRHSASASEIVAGAHPGPRPRR